MADVDWGLVGYVRVSTQEQNHEMQVQAMLEAGVHPDLIFSDIESGKKLSRKGLLDALKACRKDGTLLVWKLDRLGRNTAELIKTVQRLHERGINFRSLTQSEINTTNMQTATGALIFNLFAALAQFESDQLAERTKAGMKTARARGVRFGRKTFAELYVETGIVEKFQACRAAKQTVKHCLTKYKIPMPTYLKWRHVFSPEPVDDIGS